MLSIPTRGASSTCSMHHVRQLTSVAARLPERRLGVQRPVVPVQRPLPNLSVRCLASKSGGSGNDKSWSDIAAEAVQVGKDLAQKVGSSISSAIEAVGPSKEQREVKRREREESEPRELYREPGFGGAGSILGNLAGRALGRIVQSALGAVGEQLRQAQEQVADVQSRAAAMIESNAKVRQGLGGSARCMPPVSQSSMSQNINGRVSQVVSLVLPVVGERGLTASAQVQWTEGGQRRGGGEELRVSVQLPSGEVLRLGGKDSAGRTIDVEWRSVD